MSQTAVEVAEARPPTEWRDLTLRGIGLLLVGIGVVWVLWQAVTRPEQFFSATLDGLNNGALYALIALGYTMVYGIIELINFSHGDLFMLATVMSGIVMITWIGAETANLAGIFAMLLVLVLAMIAAAGVNMGAERVAYRRLRRAPKLAPLITAVGLSFAYQWGGIRLNGSGPQNWNTLFGSTGFNIGEVRVRWATIVVIVVTVPLLLAMTYVVQNTRQGKAMRAVAQDQDAARLMGINVDRTIAFTFGLGGALAGAAGLLYLQSVGTTSYDAGFRLGLIAFTAAVLGGIGNLTGAVIGGVLIGLIQGYNDGLGPGQGWTQTAVFTILILLMVFKPEGLLGTATTEKV